MSIFGRLRRPPPATTTLATRSQIRPPETWGQAAPVWESLRLWLSGKAPVDPLPVTRQDFLAALDGLGGRGAQDLRLRGEHAHSMRELWHLRAELYNLIARQLSQAEAEHRLAQVNRHFTAQTTASRTPRPQRTRAPTPSGHHHPSETIF